MCVTTASLPRFDEIKHEPDDAVTGTAFSRHRKGTWPTWWRNHAKNWAHITSKQVQARNISVQQPIIRECR